MHQKSVKTAKLFSCLIYVVYGILQTVAYLYCTICGVTTYKYDVIRMSLLKHIECGIDDTHYMYKFGSYT